MISKRFRQGIKAHRWPPPYRIWARRCTAGILCVCLLLSTIMGIASAASASCPHHPEHTQTCGFQPEPEGNPCGFVCEICSNADPSPHSPAPIADDTSTPIEIGAWEWIAPESTVLLQKDGEWTMFKDGNKFNTKDKPLTAEILEPMLPSQIYAIPSDRTLSPVLIDLEWDLTDYPSDMMYDETPTDPTTPKPSATITAQMVGDDYVLADNAPELCVTVTVWQRFAKSWTCKISDQIQLSSSAKRSWKTTFATSKTIEELLEDGSLDRIFPSKIEVDMWSDHQGSLNLGWEQSEVESEWDDESKTYTFHSKLLTDDFGIDASFGMPSIIVELIEPEPGWLDEIAWSNTDSNIEISPTKGQIHWAAHIRNIRERITPERLAELLPSSISARVHTDQNPAGKTQVVNLEWEAFDDLPEDGTYNGSYRFYAMVPDSYTVAGAEPGGEHRLTVNVILEEQLVTDDMDTILKRHTVPSVEPASTVVNLFDYIAEKDGAFENDIGSKDDWHIYQSTGEAIPWSTEQNWNQGINENRLLLFGDGLIHAGLWNKGAGQITEYGKLHAGMTDIVKSVLEHGYPVVNLDNYQDKPEDYEKISDYQITGDHNEEYYTDSKSDNIQNISNTVYENWKQSGNSASLNYLFDPENQEAERYRRTYENVKGLFQLNDQGYYTYNMRKNYAEFVEEPNAQEESDGHFVLYDSPAISRTDGTNSFGHFFPFNPAKDAFTGEGILSGQLVGSSKASTNTDTSFVNHHFGMTVEVEFRQPVDGTLNKGSNELPMTFEFAGDDDVWVFLDDVLVLDLGGIHSELYGTIDFSNGNVYVGRAFDTKGIPEDPTDPDHLAFQTTIREMFQKAGKEDSTQWAGNTFSSNSDHTLKMFYMERGNYDSSLALRFNLQPRLYQQIKKVDQYGNPLKDIEFELYAAEVAKASDPGAIVCTNHVQSPDGKPVYVKPSGEVLARLKTGADGVAQFAELDEFGVDGMPQPFNFADRYHQEGIQSYILKETKTPDGYRPLPTDIVLNYEPKSTMLVVANRWTTGSYASFTSTITGNGLITYGAFDPITGDINQSDQHVTKQDQKDGLVVAIPMLYHQKEARWKALYGSNMASFHTVTPTNREVVAWRQAALSAVLYQASDTLPHTPKWFLVWNEQNNRLEGFLSDQPGRADRYQLHNSENPDMKMVYAIIDAQALAKLGIDEESEEERYRALGEYVNQKVADQGLTKEQAVRETMEEIYGANGANGRGFSFLNVDQFIRTFRSLIYIPNEQRELRVQKIDQDGYPVNGAEFRLYEDQACTKEVSSGITANVDGQDGMLIFAPYDTDQPGHAKIEWASSINTRYYLKEISAPDGYEINPTVIPIIVGIYSIYADAGTPDDGVTVMAGVGKLAQTMGKFATDGEVDITLRDITAVGQVQPSGSFDLHGWKDLYLEGTEIPRSMDLHYGQNAVVDYGLHDVDGGKTIQPFFVTNTGFLRARAQQNAQALRGENKDTDSENNADWDDLGEQDITSLFSLLNIVVVTNQTIPDTNTGQLSIRKLIKGSGLSREDYTQNFTFRVDLTGSDGKPLAGIYHFYGSDKSGYITSGGSLPLHHDESITIQGLPDGTKFTVTETPEKGFYPDPESGIIRGGITTHTTASAFFTNTKEPPSEEETGSLTFGKTVDGEDADRDQRFKFTIKLQGNGKFSHDGKEYHLPQTLTFRLKDGESVTIDDLPVGTRYTVSEASDPDYTVSKEGDAKGTITANEDRWVEFYNHKKPDIPNRLTIRKTVTGQQGDLEKEFHFTVTLRDQNGSVLPGSYEYTGTKSGRLRSGDTITLKDAQWITIHDLPSSTSYTVMEREANQDGYTTTSTGATGSISNTHSATAQFYNQKGPIEDPPAVTPPPTEPPQTDPPSEDPPSPMEPPDRESPPNFPPPDPPQTGDPSMSVLWAVLWVSSLSALCLLFVTRKKKKKS